MLPCTTPRVPVVLLAASLLTESALGFAYPAARHCFVASVSGLDKQPWLLPSLSRCARDTISAVVTYDAVDPVQWDDFPDESTRRVALEAAFNQIDADGDATLSLDELRKAGFDAKLVLKQLDANRDGRLSRDEFVAGQLLKTSTDMLYSSRTFPDERTRRMALEAAFTRVDVNGDASVDFEELTRAGFDASLVLERLDTNRDGCLSRSEFVDQMLLMSSSARSLAAWELAERVEATQQLAKGESVWGSRSVRRAIAQPRFELVSLVAVLVTSMCFAVGTLDLPQTQQVLITQVEDVISVIFAVEYGLRWWGRSFSKRALIEPAALIDLLSFAPFLLELAYIYAMGDSSTALMSGVDASDFAFLRLLRVLRLQRYVADMRSFRRFEAALGFNPLEVAPYQLEVARVITSIFTLLFISSGLIYNAEHLSNPQIPDYFTALYFGLTTLTTVGFGDITPVTAEGRLVVSFSILAGIAVIPVQLSSLAEALFGDRRGSDTLPGAPPPAAAVEAASQPMAAAPQQVVDRFDAYKEYSLGDLLVEARAGDYLGTLQAAHFDPARMYKVLSKRGSGELISRLAELGLPAAVAGAIVDEFY